MTLADAYAGRTALVTGGLGFIGSALSIELARLGARVTIIDALIPEHGGNPLNVAGIAHQVRVNISDVRDSASMRYLVQGQEFIFHLAGQVSHGDSMREPMVDLGVNAEATLNLLEACRSHNREARLVYTSTRQVYGRPRSVPVREDHPTTPVDVNGVHKLAGEYHHLLYDSVYDIASTVLRLTNTYGPRQRIKGDRQGFTGIMIREALAGERLQVFGSGEQKRDFNYVDDVVQAILLAGATPRCHGRVFNLGAPDPCSVLDFARLLSRMCGVDYERVPFPDDRKLIDIGDYYGDYSAFKQATGWDARVGLDEGLRRTIEFYRAHWDAYGG